MPATDYSDINTFVKPADIKDVIAYVLEHDPEGPETAKMAMAWDSLNALLTPAYERALAVDLKLAVDEYVDIIGPRPERTADLEEWQTGFDDHMKKAIDEKTRTMLGDGWCDTYLVNSDLDDTDANVIAQAARVGTDTILDGLLAASSKNKMLSKVGIVPSSFERPASVVEEDEFGGAEVPAGTALIVIDPLSTMLEDEFGGDVDTVATALLSEQDQRAQDLVERNTPRRGRPYISGNAVTDPEALKVLLAVRDNAVDTDAALASTIFKCSRSTISNFATGKAPFAPTPAQLQALRDLAAARGNALLNALRAGGQ